MRETKCRAWNKKERIMWSWDLMNRNKIFALDSKLPFRESWIVIPNHEDTILMWFTCLYGRYKREVYEEDILNPIIINGTITHGVVKFINGCFCVKQIGAEGLYDCLNKHKGYEVIGNTFENPELMNQNGHN